MKQAWEIFKAKDNRSATYVMTKVLAHHGMYHINVEEKIHTFAQALKFAWNEAKKVAKVAALDANSEVKARLEEIDSEIFQLEMKDSLLAISRTAPVGYGNADRNRYHSLKAERSALMAEIAA